MNIENSRRMYSPQLSDMASISVRRFAWATGKSMPATIDLMVMLLPTIVDPSKVCLLCQDKDKCQKCIFCKQVDTQELTVLETVI